MILYSIVLFLTFDIYESIKLNLTYFFIKSYAF